MLNEIGSLLLLPNESDFVHAGVRVFNPWK